MTRYCSCISTSEDFFFLFTKALYDLEMSLLVYQEKPLLDV